MKGGMDMLKEYPYHLLKQDARSYEIMLLRDQHGNTFADIAKEYQISAASAAQKYYMLKVKQIRLYLNHLSIALGQRISRRPKANLTKPMTAIRISRSPARIWKKSIRIFYWNTAAGRRECLRSF